MPDIKTLAVPVGALLRQRAETVAVGESSAGGLISAALLAVPGASSYYKVWLITQPRWSLTSDNTCMSAVC